MTRDSAILPLNFRSLCTEHPRWYDSRKSEGHSNFQFVEDHYGSLHSLRRIFSLARKLGFQSFCEEEIKQDAAIMLEEDAALIERNCGFIRSNATRISFFKTNKQDAENGQFTRDDYLGYVIIKKDICKSNEDSRQYVYESVLRPYRDASLNSFLHCYRQYAVEYPFGTFNVRGTLYAQQNDLTFVCAHVAIRSVVSTIIPEGDISYSTINELAEISITNGKIGKGQGVKHTQLETVLDKLGLISRKIANVSSQDILSTYSQYLYSFIESNNPVLLAFPTSGNSGHVISLIGHTFNEDMWVPDADRYFGTKRYYSSERWLSSFLIHDDNYGPYLCLPRQYLDNKPITLYGLSRTSNSLYFDYAERAVSTFLTNFANVIRGGVDWYSTFVAFAQNHMLVLRAVYLDKHIYLSHLPKEIINESGTRLMSVLPDAFWMVEISFPELFSATKAKVGEVLLDCDPKVNNERMVTPLFLRLPGIVYFEGDESAQLTSSENTLSYCSLLDNLK